MIAPWLVWTIVAVVCWGLWALVSKLIGDALTAVQSQALSTIGIIPVIVALTRSRMLQAHGTKSKGVALAFAAGTLVCVGNMAYYHALNLGGKASTVVPLTALYPLVTTALAVMLLGEKLNNIQRCGIILSIVSIALFNIAGLDGLATGWLAYALVPIALWGVGGLLQKIATNHISGELSAVWFLTAFIPVGIILYFLQPLQAPISSRTWSLAILMGLLFAFGNLALLLAFAKNGKASIIAPLAGLYPMVSIPIAIIFLREKIGPREGLGIAVALLAVAALAYERPTKQTT